MSTKPPDGSRERSADERPVVEHLRREFRKPKDNVVPGITRFLLDAPKDHEEFGVSLTELGDLYKVYQREVVGEVDKGERYG